MLDEIITELRRQKEITQETLANALGVSTQAVSKWETGNSMPDVTLIPKIAAYFGVTTDRLFGLAEPCPEKAQTGGKQPDYPWPDDGILRVIQFLGTKLISKNELKLGQTINLHVPEDLAEVQLSVEVWGTCTVDGDISGNVTAGATVACADVGGNMIAGNSAEAADISGNVSAGAKVSCSGDVEGDVNCGGGLTCAEIEGDIRSCGGNIACSGDIGGSVKCEGGVRCRDIGGDVDAKGGVCRGAD